MTKCSFYRTEAMTVRTQPQRSDRREGPPKRVMAAFCVHTFSPMKREAALNGGQLVCGGDLAKCPIADKL